MTKEDLILSSINELKEEHREFQKKIEEIMLKLAEERGKDGVQKEKEIRKFDVKKTMIASIPGAVIALLALILNIFIFVSR